jgi:thiol:disulfide interchange protein DsbD
MPCSSAWGANSPYDLCVKTRSAILPTLLVVAIAAAGAGWWLFASRAGQAVVVVTEHAEAELIAARGAVEPGKRLLVALRLKAKPGWHTYWRNPGDSGQPTSIEWQLPPGFTAGAIRWPVPQRLLIGPLANYGYEGETLLASEIGVPADAKGVAKLAARARWLVCNPEHCIPEHAEVALTLPAGGAAPGKWSAAFDAIHLPQALPGPWELSARRKGSHVLLEVIGTGETTLTFFPYEEGKVQHAARQALERTGAGIRLSIPVSSQPVGEFARLTGVLVTGGRHAFEIDVPVMPAPN